MLDFDISCEKKNIFERLFDNLHFFFRSPLQLLKLTVTRGILTRDSPLFMHHHIVGIFLPFSNLSMGVFNIIQFIIFTVNRLVVVYFPNHYLLLN